MKDNVKYVLRQFLYILICPAILVLFVWIIEPQRKKAIDTDITLLPENATFLMDEAGGEALYQALSHYGFPHPDIITAQAILETGNFKSRNCLERNNIFGIYNNRKKAYIEFDSWVDCVIMYKEKILSRYESGEDYYMFLDRIGYAEDPDYIKKLRAVVESMGDYGQSEDNQDR